MKWEKKKDEAKHSQTKKQKTTIDDWRCDKIVYAEQCEGYRLADHRYEKTCMGTYKYTIDIDTYNRDKQLTSYNELLSQTI